MLGGSTRIFWLYMDTPCISGTHERITAVRAHIVPDHRESIASDESHLAYRASHELLHLDTTPGTRELIESDVAGAS